ncbi:MAG TPA: hypothetical protein VLV49_15145, partial [Terriglobales bacterium]|nr:hypothetical protein [Terriglobales bacterium]
MANLPQILVAAITFSLALGQRPAGTNRPSGSPPRFLLGVVETLDGRPLSGELVSLTNLVNTTASAQGEFAIAVPPRLQPGDPEQISLGDDWLIVDPWEGETFVSPGFVEIIFIRAAHKGDPRILDNPRLMEKILISFMSLMPPAGVSGGELDQLLQAKAQALGFSLEEVKAAIVRWSGNAQTPFQKGLAALYARHYAEASMYLGQTADCSGEELIERYVG